MPIAAGSLALFVVAAWSCWLSSCGSAPGAIGAILARTDTGRVRVRRAPSGLPAATAGLSEGDEILLIDGRDVRRMSPDAIHRALEGEIGSTVHLTMLQKSRVERIDVRRAALVPTEP